MLWFLDNIMLRSAFGSILVSVQQEHYIHDVADTAVPVVCLASTHVRISYKNTCMHLVILVHALS